MTRYLDGMLIFVTSHFSDYAIVYDESMENETGKPEATATVQWGKAEVAGSTGPIVRNDTKQS